MKPQVIILTGSPAYQSVVLRCSRGMLHLNLSKDLEEDALPQ